MRALVAGAICAQSAAGRAGAVTVPRAVPPGSRTVKVGVMRPPVSAPVVSTTQSPGRAGVAKAGTSMPRRPLVSSAARLAAGAGGMARRAGGGASSCEATVPGAPSNGRGRPPQLASASRAAPSARLDQRTGHHHGQQQQDDEKIHVGHGVGHSLMTEIWWPMGPELASVRRRWLKKRASSAKVSCPVTLTLPMPSWRNRAAQ